MAAALIDISSSELKFSMERSCICRTVISVCSSQNKPVWIYLLVSSSVHAQKRRSGRRGPARPCFHAPSLPQGMQMLLVCRKAGLSCPGGPSYNDSILNSQCCHCTAPTVSPATCVLLGKSITQHCWQGCVIQHSIAIRKGGTLQEQRWGTNWGWYSLLALF